MACGVTSQTRKIRGKETRITDISDINTWLNVLQQPTSPHLNDLYLAEYYTVLYCHVYLFSSLVLPHHSLFLFAGEILCSILCRVNNISTVCKSHQRVRNCSWCRMEGFTSNGSVT